MKECRWFIQRWEDNCCIFAMKMTPKDAYCLIKNNDRINSLHSLRAAIFNCCCCGLKGLMYSVKKRGKIKLNIFMDTYKMIVYCVIRGFWQTTVHSMQIWSQDSMHHENSLHLSFKWKHHHIVTANLRCEKSQQKLLVNFDVPGVLSETIFFLFHAPAIKMAQPPLHKALTTW